MKSEQTKQLIKEGFIQLLDEHPIDEISINDIAEKSGVNRNTIYYHFKNIPDLLESIARDMIDHVIAEYPPTYDSLEDCLMAAITMMKKDEKVVRHIFNSSDRRVFERYLWHILDYTISMFMNSFQPTDEKVTDEERLILKKCFEYLCYGFMIDWVDHGMREDVTEKMKILVKFIVNGEAARITAR